MMELLRKSCKDRDQAIIMVTHDARAASYADRIVFLRDGQQINTLVFASDDPLTTRLRQVIAALEQLES